MRDAIIGDIVIDDIFEKLDWEELELISESLVSALDGSCDEFCYRLFENLLPERLENDRNGHWHAVQDFLKKFDVEI